MLVTALNRPFTAAVRGQVGYLILLLLLNFPQLRCTGGHDDGIRYTTKNEEDARLHRQLSADRCFTGGHLHRHGRRSPDRSGPTGNWATTCNMRWGRGLR
ncbi:hypothetical protein PR003_g29535 [Phytophthora rubi]|uniref:Secreted protein n=1 Tax=Phytophthora rubi TaxID=129364 RepID=A0A6A4BM60_9STRA|nr:hypothetical protein PR003_g29535 [Phytophthora rubi]